MEGCFWHRQDEPEEAVFGGLPLHAYSQPIHTRTPNHRSLPTQELEHHLPAGLEIVGVYGDSFKQTAAVYNELGLPLPGLLGKRVGGAVTFQDTQVGTQNGHEGRSEGRKIR